MSKEQHSYGVDWEADELWLAKRYEQLARYEAFDKLIDMALDGVITMEQAKIAWESEIVEHGGTPVTD